MKNRLPIIAILMALLVSSANARTFFIDFSGGDNANPGTKAAPWKHHPWMRGSTVAGYAHQAGDRFIFKGGVAWPNAALPLVVYAGGASGSLMDYYGADLTWFNGASFTKPRFDAEDAETASGNRFIIGQGNHNYQIDNLLFDRFFWSGESLYSQDVIVLVGEGTNVWISNCLFTNWSHAPYNCAPGGTKASGLYCVLGNNSPPYNHGSVITNCVFDSGGRMADPGGQACYVWPNVFNSRAHRMANGFLTGYNSHVYGCEVGPIIVPQDCGYTHDNQIETVNGGSHYIHDNVLYGAGTVCVFVGGYGLGNTNYFWNNVAFDSPINPFSLDNLAANPGGTAYIWNNTLVANGACIRLVTRGGGSRLQKVVMQNNLFITDHAAPVSFEVPITTVVNDHNIRLTHAQAAAQGLTARNRYAPTDQGNSTVNAGTDAPRHYFTKDILGVPRAGAWDVGAYEFVPTIDTFAPVIVSVAATYAQHNSALITVITDEPAKTTVNWGATAAYGSNSVGATFTDTGVIPITGLSPATTYHFAVGCVDASNNVAVSGDNTFRTAPIIRDLSRIQAESGALFMLGVGTSGTNIYIHQEEDTIGETNGSGRASYAMFIVTNGQYRVNAFVDAPDNSSNSWFLEFNAPPAAPQHTWDVLNPTAGFELRPVSSRGDGAFDAPEFDPWLVKLFAGVNVLNWAGREHCKLDYFSVDLVPAADPPTPPRVESSVTFSGRIRIP